MALTVIGLDFGNFNSFTSFIQELDYRSGRLGGRPSELIPENLKEGIPSIFFYQNGEAPKTCQAAERAKPLANQVRYLKRGLFKPLEIDGQRVRIEGKDWDYDDAIRAVIQDILQQANDQMFIKNRQTTNLVSLAYPVKYGHAQIERLIEIVQSVSVQLRDENGQSRTQNVRVFGTIPEPAAAALDYLSDHEDARKSEAITVAAFDLGGGTFDAAVVRCYPNGRKRPDGSVYYYDLLWQDGLTDLGGKEFTQLVVGIVEKKMKEGNIAFSDKQAEKLRLEKAEKAKCDLSDFESIEIEVKDDVYIEVKREEFENAARPLVERMAEVLRPAMQSDEFKPDFVILAGGACRMPIVKKVLDERFPAWKGRIDAFRPIKAISYGAARYGVAEPSVQKRTAFDLGTNCRHADNGEEFIDCFVSENTPIPHESAWKNYTTNHDNQSGVLMDIYEAIVHNPDKEHLSRDYKKIIDCRLPFRRPVPKGTPIQGRVLIDERGVITIEAREKEGDKPVRAEGTITVN